MRFMGYRLMHHRLEELRNKVRYRLIKLQFFKDL